MASSFRFASGVRRSARRQCCQTYVDGFQRRNAGEIIERRVSDFRASQIDALQALPLFTAAMPSSVISSA
jgi:hypothetical protein